MHIAGNRQLVSPNFLRYYRLLGNNCLLVTALTNSLPISTKTTEFYTTLNSLNIKTNIADPVFHNDQHFVRFVQDTFINLHNAGYIEMTNTEHKLKKLTLNDIELISEKLPNKFGFTTMSSF